MNTIPADSSALVEAMTGQPGLFSDLDVSPAVVRAGRDYCHTGTTTSNDHEAAAKIIAAACLGWSERKIARDLGHSRNTVGAVIRLAERAGKVEPIKERVIAAAAAALMQDIELGNDLAESAEKPDQISALAALRRSTWVGAEILADKGTAGQPAQVVVNVGAGSVVQVVQDYAARLADVSLAAKSSETPVIEARPVDCQSTPAGLDSPPDSIKGGAAGLGFGPVEESNDG